MISPLDVREVDREEATLVREAFDRDTGLGLLLDDGRHPSCVSDATLNDLCVMVRSGAEYIGEPVSERAAARIVARGLATMWGLQ